WMTEAIGGSDVGLSEAIAREEGGQWRLYGRKWFTSAASSQVALTLARPEGNPPGGRGLALFFVRCHDDAGRLQGIQLNRLKEKLGTRKLPTAELELLGTPAIPVMGLENGVRNITPMLNITRTWNAVVAASAMRRAIALSRDYARRRHAFGAELIDKPLHVDTLAAMQAELEGALQLTFFVVQLLGRAEHGELDTPTERLLRLLTPIAKLTTGKQAVAVTSEALECFGGAGYVEDTGIAGLLRDAQVLPIWEGTTNVLSLDVLRALSREGGLEELGALLEAIQEEALDPGLKKAARVATKALERAIEWLEEAQKAGPAEVEAGARRFALTLGRATELGLLVRQAQWSLAHASDRRPRAAALRFAQTAIDQIAWCDREEAGLLAREVGEM
ncbi:MAG: acyl-CoA dehydrogenase family protein, partial [Myxococcales bacterium]|nr:acyl-CoA dehydrogenase family protein [Myxococcales bacterium]